MAVRIGDAVLYLIAEGELRPAKVVAAWDESVDLVVFVNGDADRHFLEDARTDLQRRFDEENPAPEPATTAPPNRSECTALIMRRGMVAAGADVGEFQIE